VHNNVGDCLCVDRHAYKLGKKEKPPFVKSESPEPAADDDDKKIPGELLCLICNNLLSDAVVIPCCGNSYCDECKSQQQLRIKCGISTLQLVTFVSLSRLISCFLVGKPSTIGQPTRPTQPFILSGSISEYWAAIGCPLPQLLWW